MSKRTFAGVSSEPKYIVPTYPAPSSFDKSTLKPVPDHEGLAEAKAYLSFYPLTSSIKFIISVIDIPEPTGF